MPVYSHSRLSAFEDCPLKYRLRYIDRIPSDEEGIEAFLGSRFHDVMEKLYGDLPVRTRTLDELLAYYEERWEKKVHDKVVVTRKDRTPEDYRAMGRRFIADYYKSHFPFDRGRTIGLEKAVTIDLDGTGGRRVMGYVDRIDRTGAGSYEIHDYKTSSRLPEQKDLDEDRQLALYQIGVESMWPDARDVTLVWHYVAFDADMTSRRSGAQLEALKGEVMRLIDEIESTTDFEPREGALCDWCPYWDSCPSKKHIARVDALPEEGAAADDGVRLVDAFAELSSRKKVLQAELEGIEAELEKIREAVLAFGRKEGAEVLKGSGSLLRIKERTCLSAPAKGSEERQKLDGEIRAAGLWEELSALDAHALEKAVLSRNLDPALLLRIEPYLKHEKRLSLTLSKIKDED